LDGRPPEFAAEQRRVAVSDVRVVTSAGDERPVEAPDGLRWKGVVQNSGLGVERTGKPPVADGTPGAPVFTYDSGVIHEDLPENPVTTLRVRAERPRAAAVKAVATDAYLKNTGAKLGDEVDLTLAGNRLRVTLVKAVRQLPTIGTGELTGPSDAVPGGGG
nr:ABC transporter permease [Streptomyces sp. DSM 41633]